MGCKIFGCPCCDYILCGPSYSAFFSSSSSQECCESLPDVLTARLIGKLAYDGPGGPGVPPGPTACSNCIEPIDVTLNAVTLSPSALPADACPVGTGGGTNGRWRGFFESDCYACDEDSNVACQIKGSIEAICCGNGYLTVTLYPYNADITAEWSGDLAVFHGDNTDEPICDVGDGVNTCYTSFATAVNLSWMFDCGAGSCEGIADGHGLIIIYDPADPPGNLPDEDDDPCDCPDSIVRGDVTPVAGLKMRPMALDAKTGKPLIAEDSSSHE